MYGSSDQPDSQRRDSKHVRNEERPRVHSTDRHVHKGQSFGAGDAEQVSKGIR